MGKAFARRGAVGIAAVVVGLTLAGCQGETWVYTTPSPAPDCSQVTVIPVDDQPGASGTLGTAGRTYEILISDGAGTVVGSATQPGPLAWASGETLPIAVTSAPQFNPLIATFEEVGHPDTTAEVITAGWCPGLPVATHVTLNGNPHATQVTLGSALPVFHVDFREAIDGFDADSVVVGGTAGATATTVTLDAPTSRDPQYFVDVSSPPQDGTITLTVPAGAVTDSHGDPNAASTIVIYTLDRTPPVIPAMDDRTVYAAAGESAATVTFSVPTAQDAIAGDVTPTCLPASGSSFSMGDTTVTCTATDGASNSSQAVFTVHVMAAPAPASLSLGGPMTATKGDTIVLPFTAMDQYDQPITPDPADLQATSSIASDEVSVQSDGVHVTFNHASPHVITLAYAPAGVASDVVDTQTVQVSDPPPAALSQTGSPIAPLVAAVVVLLLAGAALLVVRRRRRHV